MGFGCCESWRSRDHGARRRKDRCEGRDPACTRQVSPRPTFESSCRSRASFQREEEIQSRPRGSLACHRRSRAGEETRPRRISVGLGRWGALRPALRTQQVPGLIGETRCRDPQPPALRCGQGPPRALGRRSSSRNRKAPRRKGSYFPLQQGFRFPKKAPIPSCASAAIAFIVMTSFAYAYAFG